MFWSFFISPPFCVKTMRFSEAGLLWFLVSCPEPSPRHSAPHASLAQTNLHPRLVKQLRALPYSLPAYLGGLPSLGSRPAQHNSWSLLRQLHQRVDNSVCRCNAGAPHQTSNQSFKDSSLEASVAFSGDRKSKVSAKTYSYAILSDGALLC